MTSETSSHLLDQIYDSALDPTKWPDTLTFVSEYIGASFMSIVPYDDPSLIYMSNGGKHALQSYTDYWFQYDTMVRIGIANKHSRRLLCDWTEVGHDNLSRDSFYQEFRRDVGIGHCLGTTFEAFPGNFQAIGINLPLGRRPLTEPELQAVDDILRHVARAITISSRSQNLLCGLPGVLDRIASGAAVVDITGRVSLANQDFKNLSAAGLSIRDGRLCCAKAKCQRSLERLIYDALSLTKGMSDFALLDRENGGRPLMARVVPLSHQASEGIFERILARRQALLVVVDLEAELVAKSANSLRHFGLTPAEARVAALVGSGLSPRQAAIRLGITETTVRTQLKHVFSKMDVNRQQDLMRIVNQLGPAI